MPRAKPRFRRDLDAVPVEDQGERYVDVRDPETGGTFRFYDFEYRVALAFDGLTLDRVVPWVKLSTGLELQVDQLQAFAARLEEMGFLEHEAAPAAAPATPSRPDAKVPLPEPPSEIASAIAAMVDRASDGEVAASDVEAPAEVEVPPRATGDDVAASRPDDNAEDAVSAPQQDKVVADGVPAPGEAEATSRADAVEGRAQPESEAREERAPPLEQPAHAPATNAAMDSTAFPVLPTPPPRPMQISTTPAGAPPPFTTPRPALTPAPFTYGPAPTVEQPSPRKRLRRSLVLFGSLGVLAAGAVLAIVLPFLFSTQDPPRPRVRVLAAAPLTILRYFDGAGVVQVVPGVTLKFPAPGKVIHMASVGSAVGAGDVVASVESARPLLDRLTHQRERLAFYQQMAEAMHQVGNTKEEEQQTAKVALRNEKIAKTLGALADVAVVVKAPGLVEKTFAREGDTAAAGSPALRLHSAGYRAIFQLPRRQFAQARRLGFCLVKVDGYVFDCTQTEEASDETHLAVSIGSIPPSLQGKDAYLARARFDNAILVPAGAVLRTGSRDEVLVVSPQSRIEPRVVTIAERDSTEAIVVQGLDPGDNIVVEAASDLRTGARVAVLP